jgi:hypothetical protein
MSGYASLDFGIIDTRIDEGADAAEAVREVERDGGGFGGAQIEDGTCSVTLRSVQEQTRAVLVEGAEFVE